MAKPIQTRLARAESRSFECEELLRRILVDLRNIRSLTPGETSRIGCLFEGEVAAIIEYRKKALLEYVRVICADHLYFGEKLLRSTGGTGRKA